MAHTSSSNPRLDESRTIIAPTGTTLTAKSWLTEAPLRMLMNNLHPDVAEHPHALVVYGGIGRAARNWQCYDKIVEVLTRLEDDETLLVQSGKPVGVFKTHTNAPRVLIANSNIVPHWANWEHFNELDKQGLMMYGQMTAGSWIYIGSQGIVQGTYETFVAMARQHFDGKAAGRWVLTGGLGGMGGAQPLAATMAGFSMLAVECDESRIDYRLRTGYVDRKATTLDEALAIIEESKQSGTPVSVGLLGNAAATVCGAMTVEAALGSRKPFDPRIHRVRGHRSQMDAALGYRHLLAQNSEIGLSHQCCERVQDPYSLRCQPQVMGACLQQIRNSADTLEIESNSVSDNPLVFAEDGDIISGGNFHAEPVAMAADNLALAIAEIGSLSERRMALLIDSGLSKLPPFLVDNGGVNSGFMIAQVTAAALASENKSLAHPASVDSLPTSANQEDHVSMATFAARRLGDMAENTRGILAVELLASAQGLDFRAPNKSSEKIEQAKAMLRERVDFYDKDRYFAPDIAKANALLLEATYNQLMPESLLPSI